MQSVYFMDFITKKPSARSVPKPPFSVFCKEMPKKLSQVDGEFLVNSIRGAPLQIVEQRCDTLSANECHIQASTRKLKVQSILTKFELQTTAQDIY